MRYICSCVQCLHELFHLSLQQLAAVDTIMTVDFIYLGLQYSWIHLLAKIYVKPWNTHWWQCHHHCWTSTCAEQQKFELTDAHLPRWGWTRRHSALSFQHSTVNKCHFWDLFSAIMFAYFFCFMLTISLFKKAPKRSALLPKSKKSWCAYLENRWVR